MANRTGARVYGCVIGVLVGLKRRVEKIDMSKNLDCIGKLSNEDIENLDVFANLTSEKEEPVAFAGRTDILDAIDTWLKSDNLLNSHGGNAFFIQGAPGAGKTSLLRRIEAANMGKCRGVLPIYLEGWEINDPLSFATRVVAASGEDVVKTMTRAKAGGHQASLSAARLAKHQEAWETYRISVTDQIKSGISPWVALWSTLKDFRKGVLLLLIDEAQSVRPDAGGLNTIAMAAHGGLTGQFKVVTVFAGLSDTESVLAEAGVSRPARGFFRLGELEQKESEQAVDGFLREFKLESSFSEDSRRVIRESLAWASEGWPRHLHHYLQGLAREVLSCIRSGSNQLDLDRVLEHGHEARVQYCAGRLRALNSDLYNDLLVKMTQDVPVGKSMPIRDLALRAREDYGLTEESAEVRFNNAVHTGVLERDEKSTECRFSIPSFHTYMKCGQDGVATVNKLRQATNAKIEHLFPRSQGLAG